MSILKPVFFINSNFHFKVKHPRRRWQSWHFFSWLGDRKERMMTSQRNTHRSVSAYINFHISNLLWDMTCNYSSIINQNQLPFHWAGSHIQGLKACCWYSCRTLQGRHIYKFMKPHPFLYRQGLSVDFTWKEHESNKKKDWGASISLLRSLR